MMSNLSYFCTFSWHCVDTNKLLIKENVQNSLPSEDFKQLFMLSSSRSCDFVEQSDSLQLPHVLQCSPLLLLLSSLSLLLPLLVVAAVSNKFWSISSMSGLPLVLGGGEDEQHSLILVSSASSSSVCICVCGCVVWPLVRVETFSSLSTSVVRSLVLTILSVVCVHVSSWGDDIWIFSKFEVSCLSVVSVWSDVFSPISSSPLSLWLSSSCSSRTSCAASSSSSSSQPTVLLSTFTYTHTHTTPQSPQ